MSILIAGDFFPTSSNKTFFADASLNQLFDRELIELFSKQELSIANIEGALTDSDNPIMKVGACFKAPVRCAATYEKMGIKIASLANNHIMDYGSKGLSDTISALNDRGIKSFGAADNLKSAGQCLTVDYQGIKLGFYSCTEYEFSCAEEDKPGANPFDELEISDQITSIKKYVDYLVVLYHGGKEYYRYPAPYLQKRCRKMAEKGADLIVCQHSHCIGCFEEYQNSFILYGQGNFLLDRGDDEFRNNALLLRVDPFSRKIEFLPVIKNGIGVRMANAEEKKDIISSLEERSSRITEKALLQKEYDKLSQAKCKIYYIWMLGLGGSIMKRLGLSGLAEKLYDRNAKRRVLNMIRCEAHRDLLINYLKNQ